MTSDGFHFELHDASQVAELLTEYALAGGKTGVLVYQEDSPAGRVATISFGGETMLQAISPDQSWRERIGPLRDAIVALPALTDQAFIRPALRGTVSWRMSIAGAQPLPELGYVNFLENRHLLDWFVPDAHGIQVLRDEHLARAHDLANWNITDLGSGRHLVETTDFEPWYATDVPDPDVVEQARHDFGAMILTAEDIATNPPPWTQQ
jgi:hypothetical protein